MSKSLQFPTTLTVARALGWVTFVEIIRDRVLYNILLFALLLFGLGYLASNLTFANPDRVVLDFGLSALNISCSMIAIFTGSGLLTREYDRRTAFVALSRPITRLQFVIGKFTGLVGVIALNWLLLSVAYLAILLLVSKGNLFDFTWTLFWGVILVLFQTIILSGTSILISSFSTASLSVIVSVGLYLIGNNISQIRMLSVKLKEPSEKFLLDSLARVLPNLEHFNLKLSVTYGLPVSWKLIVTAILYSLTLTAVFLISAGALIHRRES